MSRIRHGETGQKWTNKGHQAGLDFVSRAAQVGHNPQGCKDFKKKFYSEHRGDQSGREMEYNSCLT